MARVRRDDAKKMLINRIDPAEDRNANKEKKKAQAKTYLADMLRIGWIKGQ